MTNTMVTSQFSGHPRGLFLLSGVEMWERFSYHMMRAMLVLFLTAPVAAQGFGWANEDAYKLYGFYTGLIYVTPILGGLLADRHLGQQRALISGASLMCLGHFLMAGPGVFPWLGDMLTNGAVSMVLLDSSVSMASSLSAETLASLKAAVESMSVSDPEGLLRITAGVYRAIGLSFYAALLSLVLGAGLFLPSASSLLGGLYADDGAQRERGFFIFYLSINIGATMAPIAAGVFGERLGWHLGFTIAGFAMAVGLLAFLLLRRRLLAEIGRFPLKRKEEDYKNSVSPVSRVRSDRIRALLILASFLFVSELILGQIGGLLNVLTRDRVDREIAGTLWPAVWFQTFYPFFIVLSLLALVWLTQRLDRSGRNPTVARKFAFGFAFLSLGIFILTRALASNGLIHPLYIVSVYGLMAAGEVLIYPVARAMVTRYAPTDRTVTFMGVLFLFGALGAIASGYVASLASALGEVAVFRALLLSTALAGAALFLLNRHLVALSHGLEPVLIVK